MGIGEFEFGRVLVVVDSNTNDVSELLKSLSLPRNYEIRVKVHSNLSHPFNLTWTHRKAMAEAIDSFDYFMYLEDDIYVPWRTLEAWLRRFASVSRLGFIHGFLRVESDCAGRPIASDWRRVAERCSVIEIGGVKYIKPEAFYQACWIYPQNVMRRFVNSIAWTRGIHPWSSVIRGHRRLRDLNLTREFAAFGMACAAPGRPPVLLPVNDRGQVLDDAWIWHLPNNYAQDPTLSLLDARELVKDGFGSIPMYGIMDRAQEALKWVLYILRLDEGIRGLRANLSRLSR